MVFKAILFWVFFFSSILVSLFFVTRRNLVHAALLLVLDFVIFACIYILLNSQFVAMAQIMVYAGAIMMFFIYIIMHVGLEDKRIETWKVEPFKVVGFLFLLLILFDLFIISLRSKAFGLVGGMTPERIRRIGSIQAIAYVLYSKYVLAFEIASVLLLAGIVAAVILAKRRGES